MFGLTSAKGFDSNYDKKKKLKAKLEHDRRSLSTFSGPIPIN